MNQPPMFGAVREELRKRIDYVWQSDKLSPAERCLIHILTIEDAFGMDNAISISKVQDLQFRKGEYMHGARAIKDAVKSLLEVHGLPIGSCRVPGRNGYFFIVTDADAELASRPLQAEIFSMFRRLKVISPKSAFVRGLQGQIELLCSETKEV